MNDPYDDVIAAVRRAFEDVTYPGPSPAVVGLAPPKRRRHPFVVAGLAVAVTLALALPLAVLRTPRSPVGRASPAGREVTPTVRSTTTAESAPDEAPWRCPPTEAGDDTVLAVTDPEVPADLRLRIPPSLPEPREVFVVDRGEVCARPPSLVLLATTTTPTGRRIEASIVVWVEAPTGRGSAIPPRPEGSPGPVENFTFVEHADRPGRIEAVGNVDGLPVWVEARGVEADDLAAILATMRADVATGEVTLDAVTPPFELRRRGPVEAAVVRAAELVVSWRFDDLAYDLEVWRVPEGAPFLPGCELGSVANTEVVSCRGDRGVQLIWKLPSGNLAVLGTDADAFDGFAEVLVRELGAGSPQASRP
ncbi:MAG TPA: hypothetical protein ENK55_11895 [Actinobacteria bacterium]|nr:hypothetical protein [Actinomycetota bacterium]